MGEILLRNVKFSLRSSEIAAAVGGFNFTFCESKIFHNPKDYFISHSDISLHTTLRVDLFPLLCYNTAKAVILWKYCLKIVMLEIKS